MKLLFLILLTSLTLPAWGQSNDFPGRGIYQGVKVYETTQLYESFNDVIVVDVRSNFEYDTLHIKNSINIPLVGRNFANEVTKLQEQGKPIIFYCNGHTCYKAYKASVKAQNHKISNTFAYDAGVFDWTRAYPDKATLLGKSPVDTSRLLGKKDFKSRQIEPADFIKKMKDNKVAVLDIREPAQRGLIELFPYRQENITMDDKINLNKFLDKIKATGKTLLVYDEAGRQVRWLQYHLQDKNISNYFFMAGGVKNYFKSLKKK